MGIQDVLTNHPAVGGLVGGVVIGAGASGIVNLIRKRRAKPKKTKTTKRRTGSKRRTTTRKSPSKRTSAFKKRRAKAFRGASPKKIFHTKKGQPYIKLKSGRARFIKKSSASSRKKRKGGFS